MSPQEYPLAQIVDIEELRQLFESFSKLSGFTTGLVEQGTNEVIITTGWRNICTKFHRENQGSAVHCKSSNKKLTDNLNTLGQITLSKCENGLIDGATPIIVNGLHMANLFSGQLFFEQPNLEQFRKQAELFDYDIEAYMKAVEEVPVVSEDEFREVLHFLSRLSISLISTGLHRRATNEKIKILSGLISICASCKKIRDDEGYWKQIESYIREHSEAEFSHGICPGCVKKIYPEFVE
jgi:ligand-binding sensor protein